MIKRIIKRIKIERIMNTFGIPGATLITIIRAEWQAFQMRRRAGSLALALACGGSLQRRWRK